MLKNVQHSPQSSNSPNNPSMENFSHLPIFGIFSSNMSYMDNPYVMSDQSEINSSFQTFSPVMINDVSMMSSGGNYSHQQVQTLAESTLESLSFFIFLPN